MRYFLGYVLQGDELRNVDALRSVIAERFDTWEALRRPAHLTLVPTFQVDDVEPLAREIEIMAKNFQPFATRALGYNFFEQGVWFMDFETTPEFSTLAKTLDALVRQSPAITIEIPPRQPRAHLTLAYRDLDPQRYFDVGDFLSRQPLPLEKVTLDAFALLVHRHGSWEIDRTFTLAV